MRIEEIREVNREYVLRFTDGLGDFEDIEVNMTTEHIDPKSKFFTHCNVKLNILRSRTIDGHIEYLQTVIQALKTLKERLKDN